MNTQQSIFRFAKLFVVLALLYAGQSCNRDNQVAPSSPDPNDGILNETSLAELDAKRQMSLTTDQIVLPNGYTVKAFLTKVNSGGRSANGRMAQLLTASGPQQKKNLLIAQMATKAAELTNRTSFNYTDEGTNKPAQSGLAYVYGSRNYATRQRSLGTCTEELYGLDCSGFVLQVAAAAGIAIPNTTAAGLSKAATWENVIQKMNGLNKVHVEDLGILATNQLESGDIVFWKNSAGQVEHIGMVLQGSGGNLVIFDSHGSASSKCEANYGPKRGPSQLELSQINTFFSSSNLTYAGTLRITVDISGKWEFQAKCADRTQVAVIVPIEFNPKQTGDFTAKGTGIDYDGSPVSLSVKGLYDKKANTLTLEATTSFPDNPSDGRVDKLTVELNEDETPFVTAQKINDNSGCVMAVKLINKEK